MIFGPLNEAELKTIWTIAQISYLLRARHQYGTRHDSGHARDIGPGQVFSTVLPRALSGQCLHDCVPVLVDVVKHGEMGCYRSSKVPTLTMPVESYRRVRIHVHATIVVLKG